MFLAILLSVVYGGYHGYYSQNPEEIFNAGDMVCKWEYGIPGETNDYLPDGERRKLIVGGGVASDGEYPWHAMQLNGCGGTIIDREWILTAAHCMFDQEQNKLDEIVLSFGEGLVHRVSSEIFVHPDWDYSTAENDIALVKVEPLPCHLRPIKPVKLLDSGFDIDGCTAFMQGHGLTESPDTEQVEEEMSAPSWIEPQRYRAVLYNEETGRVEEQNLPTFNELVSKVYAHDNPICAGLAFDAMEDTYRWYGYYGRPYGYGYGGYANYYGHGHYLGRRLLEVEDSAQANDLKEAQICATTPGEDTCGGDSGGPLLIDMDTSKTSHHYVIAGITSYGEECAIKPAVYTTVSAHKEWIKSVFPNAPFQKVKECDRNDYEEGGGEKRMIAELIWRQDLVAELSEEITEISKELFE